MYETAKETLMYRTVLWTLWERERVGRFGRIALNPGPDGGYQHSTRSAALEEGGEVFAGELRSNQVLLLQKVFYQQITGEEPFLGIRNLFDMERGANPGCQLE